MGPSGSGKTTIGRRLADALGRPFIDADDHHCATNIAKMQAGIGLTDEDRHPWLRELQRILASEPRTVLACSALRRSYRTLLQPDSVGVAFLLLDVPEEELARRLITRTAHYAGPALLASQLAALESPAEEFSGFVIDGSGPEVVVLQRALAVLRPESSPVLR
jgi:gluconokinase